MNTSIKIILNGGQKSLDRNTRKDLIAGHIPCDGYAPASSSPDGTFL